MIYEFIADKLRFNLSLRAGARSWFSVRRRRRRAERRRSLEETSPQLAPSCSEGGAGGVSQDGQLGQLAVAAVLNKLLRGTWRTRGRVP